MLNSKKPLKNVSCFQIVTPCRELLASFVSALKSTKGVTMLEIVVTLALFAIGLGFSVLYYQTSQTNADLNGQVSEFVSHARLSQSHTKAGKNGTSHGIHLENDRYVLFSGDSYEEGLGENFEVKLGGAITIQNVNLEGGGNDILFVSPRGETLNYGTFDFASTQAESNITITITQIGTVDY